MAQELGVEPRVLDIDDAKQAKVADDMVKQYGDFADDYLIPQIFFEEDGKVQHVFTGFSESVEVTKARLNDFLVSQFYRTKLKERS